MMWGRLDLLGPPTLAVAHEVGLRKPNPPIWQVFPSLTKREKVIYI